MEWRCIITRIEYDDNNKSSNTSMNDNARQEEKHSKL